MDLLKKALPILLVSLVVGGSFALADEEKDFGEKIEEWESQGIDPNHSEVIADVQSYIDENKSDTFASLHIDREENELGVIVLSFTAEIAEEHKENLEALLDEHAELEIRMVDYTEEELVEKQQEIDLTVFEQDEIPVTYTSTDIIGNTVEVGISPYNEEHVEKIYDRYGKEMVTVVEAEQASILDGDDSAEQSMADRNAAEDVAQDEDLNWFQRLITAIFSFFEGLFS